MNFDVSDIDEKMFNSRIEILNNFLNVTDLIKLLVQLLSSFNRSCIRLTKISELITRPRKKSRFIQPLLGRRQITHLGLASFGYRLVEFKVVVGRV